MSQINYKMEIVQNLLRDSNHVRGLANDLKTNQTTVSRKMAKLVLYNVVDYKFEGKNKVYFLKKTLESLEYAFLSEHYKMLCALKKYPLLKKIMREILDDKKIKLAILFGSYAKNTAHKNSDIDVYIETLNAKIKEKISLANSKLSVKIGKYDRTNTLIKEIEKNHVIIKGVELFYEKIKFLD